MNKAFIIPAVIALKIFFTSCDEVIEFRGEAMESKIVVYAILNPDSLISVSISRSYPIFDPKFTYYQISNSSVRVYEDNALLETLSYVPPPPREEYLPAYPYSKYVSGIHKPDPASEYRIEVEVPGFRLASAEVRFPEVVSLAFLDTVTNYQQDEYSAQAYLETKTRFTDPPEIENFYRLVVRYTRGYYTGRTDMPYSEIFPVVVIEGTQGWVEYDPIIAPSEESDDFFGITPSNRYNLFNDELIAGREYDMSLKLFHNVPEYDYYEFNIYTINLQSLSKELYLYLRSLSSHEETEGSPFAEPVFVYSNVENGLGVVGTQINSEIVILQGNYPVEGVEYISERQFYTGR